MPDTMTVNDAEYTSLHLFGKGKGGYSYECNAYMEQWDFEHWGVQYWTAQTPERTNVI